MSTKRIRGAPAWCWVQIAERNCEEMRKDQPECSDEAGGREWERKRERRWRCNECRPPTAWPFIFQHPCSSFCFRGRPRCPAPKSHNLAGGSSAFKQRKTWFCLNTHTHTHTPTHLHTHWLLPTQPPTHTYTHIRTHTYTHMHARTHTHTHRHTHTQTHTRVTRNMLNHIQVHSNPDSKDCSNSRRVQMPKWLTVTVIRIDMKSLRKGLGVTTSGCFMLKLLTYFTASNFRGLVAPESGTAKFICASLQNRRYYKLFDVRAPCRASWGTTVHGKLLVTMLGMCQQLYA